MSQTAFDLFKNQQYTATVVRGGTEVAKYTVNVIPPSEELDKLGIKQLSLAFNPVSSFGNSYFDVKQILLEQINQTSGGSGDNAIPVVISSITFVGDSGRFTERYPVLSQGQTVPAEGGVRYVVRTDGAIERSFEGKTDKTSYIIVFTKELTSEKNYSLGFNLISWVAVILSLVIAGLAVIATGRPRTWRDWTVFGLAIVIFLFALFAILAVYAF